MHEVTISASVAYALGVKCASADMHKVVRLEKPHLLDMHYGVRFISAWQNGVGRTFSK